MGFKKFQMTKRKKSFETTSFSIIKLVSFKVSYPDSVKLKHGIFWFPLLQFSHQRWFLYYWKTMFLRRWILDKSNNNYNWSNLNNSLNWDSKRRSFGHIREHRVDFWPRRKWFNHVDHDILSSRISFHRLARSCNYFLQKKRK